jgi:hypothetical protein
MSLEYRSLEETLCVESFNSLVTFPTITRVAAAAKGRSAFGIEEG